MSLIGLLVALLIVCVVIWAARMLIAAFKIPSPIDTVIYVVIVLLAVLWFVSQLRGVRVP